MTSHANTDLSLKKCLKMSLFCLQYPKPPPQWACHQGSEEWSPVITAEARAVGSKM